MHFDHVNQINPMEQECQTSFHHGAFIANARFLVGSSPLPPGAFGTWGETPRAYGHTSPYDTSQLTPLLRQHIHTHSVT